MFRNSLHCTANGATYEINLDAQKKPTELLFGRRAEIVHDDRGVMTSRPSRMNIAATHTMSRDTGDLPLMQIFIASQRFNLKAKNADHHPNATFTCSKKSGNTTTEVSRLDIHDFQTPEYSLSWKGTGGDDDLSGCTIIEGLEFIASAGSITDLNTNEPVKFDFR